MSPAEMTYKQVIAAPDMAAEVRGLTDAELIQLRLWLAGGGSRAEVARTVQGLCMVVQAERFEEGYKREAEMRGSGNSFAMLITLASHERLEEAMKRLRPDIAAPLKNPSGFCDRCHGSEVPQ